VITLLEKDKEPLFTLSKAKGNFTVQPFKGSGKGGQKRNKTMSACRIIHSESGTVSECQEERSYEQNKKKAFMRLYENPKFQSWFKIECARRLGSIVDAEEEVNKSMKPSNIKIEIQVDGKWVEVNEDFFKGEIE